MYPVNLLSDNVPYFIILHQIILLCLKADFQSSHEAPRSWLRVMREHFHPITMLNR
jgi:hypothetical protein